MVWRVRRQVCLAVAFALALFVSRLGEVQEEQQPIPAQPTPGPPLAAAQPLRQQPKPKPCLEPLTAPQAACRHDFPVWPAVRQAAVPCSSARSSRQTETATGTETKAASDDAASAARLCSSLVDSLHLDPSARTAVAPQLQLLRTSVSAALKGAAPAAPTARCQLWAHLESTDPSAEAWLPHLSVAEQVRSERGKRVSENQCCALTVCLLSLCAADISRGVQLVDRCCATCWRGADHYPQRHGAGPETRSQDPG